MHPKFLSVTSWKWRDISLRWRDCDVIAADASGLKVLWPTAKRWGTAEKESSALFTSSLYSYYDCFTTNSEQHTHISTWTGKMYFKSENSVATDRIFSSFLSRVFINASLSTSFSLSQQLLMHHVSYHRYCLNTFIRKLPFCHGK